MELGAGKPLSAQSLLSCYGGLEDNTETDTDSGDLAGEVSESLKGHSGSFLGYSEWRLCGSGQLELRSEL